MAAWIHSSVSSFLSSTVRLKLSPVVPFTDDKEMLAHTEPILALSTHCSQASTLQFFVHPMFPCFHDHTFATSSLVPRLLFHTKKESGSETMPPLVSCPDYFSGDGEGLGMRLLRKGMLWVVDVVMVSVLFCSKITAKHNFEVTHKHWLYKALISNNHNMLTQLCIVIIQQIIPVVHNSAYFAHITPIRDVM